MLFLHTHAWIWGTSPHTGKPKWQTRRVASFWADGSMVEPRYQVGRTYAVQPARGAKAIGRIRIVARRLERPAEISAADVEAEGFASREQFLAAYGWINGGRADRPCWVYVLEPSDVPAEALS